jgi:hypothetical protein
MADLAVMIVNKLRGRDPYAPLTGPDTQRPAQLPVPPLDARMASIEERRLRTLEPSTREFVSSVLAWARQSGIPALLGETHRTEAEQQRQIREGRSAIQEGQTGWHQYGRAFHLIIVDPRTKLLDEPAYERVGTEVRRRGGEWLGDKKLRTSRGEIKDLAHFEYHPGLKLSSWRGTAQAKRELAIAERRAARYG